MQNSEKLLGNQLHVITATTHTEVNPVRDQMKTGPAFRDRHVASLFKA